MSNYDSKDGEVLGRQLEDQRIISVCNLVTAKTDLSPNITIVNTTLAATVITLDVKEPLKKCFEVSVKNRATGAIIPLAAAPSLAVAQKISVTVDGTAQTDVVVEFSYAVA